MSMLQVRNGDVWVSTSGFGMYVIPSGKDEAHYTLMFEGDNNVEDMVEAPDGAVWLAVTNYGIYRRKDGKVSRYLWDVVAWLLIVKDIFSWDRPQKDYLFSTVHVTFSCR